MTDNNNNSMLMDLEETQLATQPEQDSSQDATRLHRNEKLWGWLQPLNPKMLAIEFDKVNTAYTFGRHKDTNFVALTSMKISNHHAEITWDRDSSKCSVVVLDKSTNGTFINGEKIGKGNSRALYPGHEIAFGTCIPPPRGEEDYRFIFHFTANGPAKEGFFSEYDMVHELGRGSFATVFKVLNRQSGTWFAAKVIYGQKRIGPHAESTATNLAREISILRDLNHPNICKLENCYQEENSDLILVLELVTGGDLLALIEDRGHLPNAMAQHFSWQLCDALAYIHSRGIAHRDLKPENVLITTDDPPILKVADFGLAKVVHSATMLKTMCGTPAYLAPEVVRQTPLNQGYDNRVDSWSVGIIIFALLTGETPIVEDEAIMDMRMRILNRTIDLSALRRKDLPEPQELVTRLLVDDPMQRISLADALAQPWLKSYEPVYVFDDQHKATKVRELPIEPAPLADSGVFADASMVSASSLQVVVDGKADSQAPPSSSSQAQATPAPLAGRSILKRRGDVLARANEGEISIPVPSNDLRISNALPPENGVYTNGEAPQNGHPEDDPMDDDDAGPSGRKRRHEEVSPPRNDDAMDISPVKNRPQPAGKKQKVSKGKSRFADNIVQPRRSARNQKVVAPK